MYNEMVQYQTIGEFGFNAGVIDEHLLYEEQQREQKCVAAIASGWAQAGEYCENITVRWLYTGSEAAAGDFFYYDFGMASADEFDVITESIGTYLNRADVKAALHTEGATWVNADEVGPVAEALRKDFGKPSVPVVADLLAQGKRVTLYNGVQDGSVCNHIGNLKALLELTWAGADDFARSESVPWPSVQHVMGHIRGARNLLFATVMRTGHLVPTTAPMAFAALLEMALKPAAVPVFIV